MCRWVGLRDSYRVLYLRAITHFFIGMTLLGSALHAVQRVEDQTLPATPGITVRLDTYRGAINVVAGSNDAVRVIVALLMPTDDPAAAQTVLDGFVLRAETKDGVMQLTARNPLDRSTRFTWTKDPRPEITFTLEVPAHVHLDLQTNDGSITVDSLSGRMRARAKTGTIFFRQIDGTVDARTETGDVIVSRCTGAVTLRTHQGDVRIGMVGGRASLETVEGDIELQSAHDGVRALTQSGDITAGFANVVKASQIRTALGNIRAQINPDTAFSLRAVSGWGRVTNRLALDEVGNGRSGRLSGQLNGGGPLLELRANGGRVTIEASEVRQSL